MGEVVGKEAMQGGGEGGSFARVHAKVSDTAPPNRLTGFTKSASNFEIAD
jgi:hypothetical protein